MRIHAVTATLYGLPLDRAQDNTLSELLELINRQLAEKNLKVEKASAAVIDATIIQTAGSKQRQAIEVDEEGQVSGQTTPSKDSDARWTKKNGLYRLGYKQHTRTDEEGYIEKLHITPANVHECNHLSPLLEGIAEGTTVYADKGYDSKENRQHLKEHRLLDGIIVRSRRICHSFAEILTLFKILTVPNKLQFENANKATFPSLLFYQLQITNSPLVLPVLSLPTV